MNIEYSFWTTVSEKSPMKVLFELVRKSEGILQRIEETQNGFRFGDLGCRPKRTPAAIYIYDRLCGALFMLVVDGRDDISAAARSAAWVPAVARAPQCARRPRSVQPRPAAETGRSAPDRPQHRRNAFGPLATVAR